MRPDDWSDLKQRGDVLIAQARCNRAIMRGISESMRASEQEQIEDDYLAAIGYEADEPAELEL